MLFHTWIFLLFFAIVYPVYLLVKRTRFKNLWLLLASYVFYGWWNPLYLFLIAYSTTVDYLVVRSMSCSRKRGRRLAISVVNNLVLLGFFKYGYFVTDNINNLLASLGISYSLAMPDILLPVGISFYVFQSMSYTIDYYRQRIDREKSFIRYATFVSLFPQLVAGPIERASNLLPQLQKPRAIRIADVTEGMSLFIVGLFKKIALADALGLYVDKVYDVPSHYQTAALLLATFAFAWQIYFDFSGYTDMARGIARMMGIDLMLNFNNPYLADSLGNFWGRWHISLSTWFRDYVYIPLGGNRKGTGSTYRNMFLTMLISGLWHGAAWTFVLWGVWHGVGRVLTRHLERTDFYKMKIPKLLKQFWVFIFVMFGWIFFRAATFNDVHTILAGIFTFNFSDPQCPVVVLGLVVLVWLYQYLHESRLKTVLATAPVRIALVVLMICYLILFTSSNNQPFIYFQF